ncbi:MAG: hypothetical protein ACM3X5_01570 [Bacillota bacterium]
MAIVADRPIFVRQPPLPPRWAQRERASAEARLRQFIVLSMLLHALAILLFGSPLGGSREGRALWGSLDVVIRSAPKPQATPERKAPPALVERPAPREQEKKPPVEFPPLIDRAISPPVEAFAPIVVPPPSESELPKIESAPVLRVPEATPEIPQPLLKPLPRPVEKIELPTLEQAPAIKMPTPTPEIPAPLLQPLAAPIEATPQIPKVEAAPAIEMPTPTPEIPAPLLQPVPAANERVELPAVEPAPAIRLPEPTPAIRPQLLQPMPSAPAGERSELPQLEQAPVISAPQSAFPRETAKPPPAYDPTRPSLDPEALRARAGELSRQGVGQRALLAFPMPLPPEKKSKLETAIENARKPDCNTAYKDLGLLAVVPLIANEFGDGTCKWR